MTNEQLELAFDFLENTGANIFLTGRAGTGKTTFLHNLRIQSPKRMVVVAPTGVAAINAKGSTIHSFFQLPFGLFIPGMHRTGGEIRKFSKTKIKIIRSMELLVIDEISMVRADLLDAIDDVLRRFRMKHLPFGGVQLLMIGDLQQLSPVVKQDEWELLSQHYNSPYFFDSMALKQSSYRCIELNHIYRQTDRDFIELLAKVRDNALDDKALSQLNSRYISDFNPDKKEGYITLTSHNNIAQSINDSKLEALKGTKFTFKGVSTGNFSEYPVDNELVLKHGAQVMFARNDSSPLKRYVNGSIGEVTFISQDSIEVVISGSDETIVVTPEKWENIKYTLDEATKEITEVVDGTYTQFPLKTAWAITIHKSQGLTFDRVIIDAARSFSHGQVYVALSRCRTLEGVVLSTPLRFTSIKSDPTVIYFSKDIEDNPTTVNQLCDDKRNYYRALLIELFDFGQIMSGVSYLRRQLSENLITTYPKMIQKWNSNLELLRIDIEDVSLRFKTQIDRFMLNPNYMTDTVLTERVIKGVSYFTEKCRDIVEPLVVSLDIEIDNKEVAKIIKDGGDRLRENFAVKMSTLESAKGGFAIKEYLTAKAKATVGQVEEAKRKTRKVADVGESGDIIDDELFEVLRRWRREKAAEIDKAAFVVAHQKVLIALAERKPRNFDDMLEIKGIGKAFVQKYGDEILEIVAGY